MEHEHVLSALARKRGELAGEAAALRARLAQIATDLAHVDATIRLFDPDYDLADIRAKRPRGPDVARPGEMSRFVLDALREATEPLSTPTIAARLMTERGMNQGSRNAVRNVTKRVGMALRHQEQRGVVRSKAGAGRMLLWGLAQGTFRRSQRSYGLIARHSICKVRLWPRSQLSARFLMQLWQHTLPVAIQTCSFLSLKQLG